MEQICTIGLGALRGDRSLNRICGLLLLALLRRREQESSSPQLSQKQPCKGSALLRNW